jgi:hypothetical protein
VTDADAYRSTRRQLFVDLTAGVSAVNGGGYFEVPPKAITASPANGHLLGKIGPSHQYVENSARWPWANPGGDWINRDGTAQATSNPHFSFSANAAASGFASYSASITAGASAALARGKWNAYIVKVSGGTRALVTHNHPSQPAPRISVTYTDGSAATLACLACVQLVPGNAYSLIGASEANIRDSVALEFELPSKPVASATLTISVAQHTSTAATISGYLANPPVNNNPVVLGVAANYPQDAGLRNDPAILFAQRYEDGTALGDYIIQNLSGLSVWDINNWDPELFGTGPANPAKLPTAFNGVPVAGTHKWIYKQTTDTISLVSSSYRGEGFEPSATGLGALRVVTPRSTAADGGAVGYVGALGADLWALFPKSISGLVSETFVRFRVRFATAPKPLASTKAFRTQAGAVADYAIREGKWGIGTHHWTPYGGNDNVGGENLGHSNRLGLNVHPADVPNMGVQAYVHSYDMLKTNMPFGSEGGLGASFYPGRWYWVEIRKKLNTYNPTGPIGSAQADGIMEIYIDGRLASRTTGWKYRDGALDYSANGTPPSAGRLVPFRHIGDIGLQMNHYNGGVKAADEDTIVFIAQVACATRYIGLPG